MSCVYVCDLSESLKKLSSFYNFSPIFFIYRGSKAKLLVNQKSFVIFASLFSDDSNAKMLTKKLTQFPLLLRSLSECLRELLIRSFQFL